MNLLFDTVKKTAKHSLIYGIGTSFAAISGLILVPIYTRFLSPAEYGAYSLISVMVALLFFVYDFGMVNALFRWYYQYTAEEVALRRRVVSTAFIFLFFLALSCTAVLWRLAPDISRMMFMSSDFARIIRLMLIGVFLQSLTIVPFSLLRIKQKSGVFTTLVIAGIFIMIASNFIFLKMGMGIEGIYKAYIVTYLFIAIGLGVVTRADHTIAFSLKELKGMLAFGIPYMPVLLFSWIIDFSDRYLLGRLANLQDVGLYSIGYKIGQVLYLAEKTFLIAWVPLMLSLYQKQKEKSHEIFGGVFTYFVLFIFLLFLSVSVFGNEIIRIFTSASYMGSVKVIPWIAFAYLLSGVYIYMLSGLIIAKNVIVQPVVLSLAAVINIGLNMFLIPRFGMMGSAYATTFSYLLVAAITGYFSQKACPIMLEWSRLGKIALCSALIYFSSTLVQLNGLIGSMLIKSILMALFFVLLYSMGFFHRSEIDRFKLIFSGKKLAGNA